MSDFQTAAERDALAERIREEQASATIRERDRAGTCVAYLREWEANQRVGGRVVAYLEHMKTVAGDDAELRAGAEAALLGLATVERASRAVVAAAEAEARAADYAGPA